MKLLFLFRLSSIDMKYHIWKLGVVFTDNVSIVPETNKQVLYPKSRISLDATRNDPALNFLASFPG